MPAISCASGAGRREGVNENMQKELIQSLDLNEKQAKVYMACLELGTDTVLHIAKKAELKRPTVYVVLGELTKKGLVEMIPKKTKTVYVAKKPEVLLRKIREKEKMFQSILPELSAFYNQAQMKPVAKMYEGMEEVQTVYEDIFSSKEIIFFSNYDSVPKEQLEKNFVKFINDNPKVSVKELTADSEYAREYIRKFQTANFEVRVVPKEFPFNIEAVIYQNKLAIFSFESGPQGFVIESERISQAFRSLFEFAWPNGMVVK